MNWLDVLIIIVLIVSALMGLKTGLIGALFTVGAVLIGWLLAGRWSDDIGALFGDSLSNDTLVTVIVYAIILIVSLFAARIVAKVVRPTLGLLVGAFITGAIFMGMARLAYNFKVEELDTGIAAVVTEHLPNVDAIRGNVESALMESRGAPIFVDVATALPGSTLGFVPDDFRVALDILDQRINETAATP